MDTKQFYEIMAKVASQSAEQAIKRNNEEGCGRLTQENLHLSQRVALLEEEVLTLKAFYDASMNWYDRIRAAEAVKAKIETERVETFKPFFPQADRPPHN